MRILESYLKGKSLDQNLCEDGFLVTDHYICIVDGATSKTNRKIEGKSTGRMAAETVLEAVSGFPKYLTHDEAFQILTEHFESVYESSGLLKSAQESPCERMSASTIIYSRHRNQLWVLGDCHLMIDGRYHNFDKEIDRVVSESRALFLELELQQGRKLSELLADDLSQKFIEPLLKNQNYFENYMEPNLFAYGVVNGFPIPSSAIKIIELDPTSSQEIVLASDGYPIIRPTLVESENELEGLLSRDPLLFREFKTTKGLKQGNESYDDRVYVRFLT